ncbi:hypothetical protein OGAPHI_000797 [Ogataea philodendri]|uniref:C2H2-type domain-containing protein n=1 Tax=Ogataea philodendri TaxID=1378263 RepID=A0A9P8T9P6_9ASCO|nr:uncharacterized protein OGAPHI_000797 [Ogataea philodendri]KAH3671086.1 hypothetical protein OGAPHI_000797 [Ogataea philodendri]
MDPTDTPAPLMEFVSSFDYSELQLIDQKKDTLVSELKEVGFDAGDFLHEIQYDDQYDDLYYSDAECDVDVDFEGSRFSNTPETSQQRFGLEEDDDLPELTIDPAKVDLSGTKPKASFPMAYVYQSVYSETVPSSPLGLGQFDTSYSAFPDVFVMESTPETPMSYHATSSSESLHGSPSLDASPVELESGPLDLDDDPKHKRKKSKITLRIPGKSPHRASMPLGGKLVCEMEDCGKQFKNRALLSRHINCVHLHLERYVCKFCSRKFTRSDHMKIHVGRMHQERFVVWEPERRLLAQPELRVRGVPTGQVEERFPVGVCVLEVRLCVCQERCLAQLRDDLLQFANVGEDGVFFLSEPRADHRVAVRVFFLDGVIERLQELLVVEARVDFLEHLGHFVWLVMEPHGFPLVRVVVQVAGHLYGADIFLGVEEIDRVELFGLRKRLQHVHHRVGPVERGVWIAAVDAEVLNRAERAEDEVADVHHEDRHDGDRGDRPHAEKSAPPTGGGGRHAVSDRDETQEREVAAQVVRPAFVHGEQQRAQQPEHQPRHNDGHCAEQLLVAQSSAVDVLHAVEAVLGRQVGGQTERDQSDNTPEQREGLGRARGGDKVAEPDGENGDYGKVQGLAVRDVEQSSEHAGPPHEPHNKEHGLQHERVLHPVDVERGRVLVEEHAELVQGEQHKVGKVQHHGVHGEPEPVRVGELVIVLLGYEPDVVYNHQHEQHEAGHEPARDRDQLGLVVREFAPEVEQQTDVGGEPARHGDRVHRVTPNLVCPRWFPGYTVLFPVANNGSHRQQVRERANTPANEREVRRTDEPEYELRVAGLHAEVVDVPVCIVEQRVVVVLHLGGGAFEDGGFDLG